MSAKKPAPATMRGHRSPFAEYEKAENLSATRRRLFGYFRHEKALVALMFAAVAAATLLGLWGPALQSRAIDIIAGQSRADFAQTLVLILAAAAGAAIFIYLIVIGAGTEAMLPVFMLVLIAALI